MLPQSRQAADLHGLASRPPETREAVRNHWPMPRHFIPKRRDAGLYLVVHPPFKGALPPSRRACQPLLLFLRTFAPSYRPIHSLDISNLIRFVCALQDAFHFPRRRHHCRSRQCPRRRGPGYAHDHGLADCLSEPSSVLGRRVPQRMRREGCDLPVPLHRGMLKQLRRRM